MQNFLKPKSYKLKPHRKSFTLLELLIVIGIIAVLVAVAVVAINPGRQFAKANNARRMHDLRQILSAIQQNMIDNRGPFSCVAGAIPACAADGSGTIMGSGAGQYNICSCLVPTYLPQMPVDPQFGNWGGDCSNYDTQYEICTASLKLRAPHTQLAAETGIIELTLPGEITVRTPPWDFTLSVTPTSASVSQGNSVSATVTATLISGTSQTVSFSASGLPTNATVSFSPTSCNPTCSSTMQITTASTTPTGTYTITITGTGGGETRTTTYYLTVTAAVTEQPIWASATCQAGVSAPSGPFAWNYSMGYEFTPQVNGQVTRLCGFFQGTKWVRLYDSTYSTSTVVSAQVSGNAPTSWVCTSITPINVTAGSVYYVVAEIASSGGYYQSSAGLPKTCNNVTINASVYQSPSGTFNASHFETTSFMYGMADIMFAQ